MDQIPVDAIARLTMISGNLSDPAEIAQIFESYSYQQDNNRPNRWILTDTSAALEFSQDGKIIDVYSDSDENILNLNYIAMRIGWVECNIYTIDEEIKDNLLLRLVNIGVTTPNSTSCDIKTSSPSQISKSAFSSGATEAEDVEQSSNDDIQRDDHQIKELRNKLANAERQNAKLSAENHQLRQRLQEFENIPISSKYVQSAGTSNAQLSADPVLIRIIENHLLSQLDLSAVNQSGLMKELNEHGYNVHVKLTKQ